MSLVMLYRSCLAADKQVCDLRGHVSIDSKLSKLYLSEDKKFAGACCGHILNNKDWNDIRNIIDVHVLKNGVDDDIEKDFESFSKRIKIHCSVIVIYGDQNLIIDFEPSDKENPITISDVDFESHYFFGTGQFAARVLANSGQAIDQEKFFRIVSMSDRLVSSDFELIELKNVINSHRYKK